MALDINEYLPPETYRWCTQALTLAGFSTQLNGTEFNRTTGERTHTLAYLSLRDKIAEHIDSQQEPMLSLCSPLTLQRGALARLVPTVQEFRDWMGPSYNDYADLVRQFLDGEV